MKFCLFRRRNAIKSQITIHPIKAAGTAALCWVFSIVQRKDRLSGGTAPQGFPAGWHRQAAGEAGTKCCPHERGHYGHCTGWKRTFGIRGQTSYFICTYRSFFQRGCGLFLFDTFLFYSQTYYKRIHDFHYGRTWDFSGALFLRLNAPALQGARTAAPVLELFTKFQDWRESE